MDNHIDNWILKIPAYLRGELSDAERQELKQAAELNPAIADEITFQQNLRLAVPEVDLPTDGWNKLQAAMRAESSEAKAEVKHASPLKLVSSTERPKVVSNAREIENQAANSNTPSGVNPFWRIAAAVLAVVGIGQAGLLAVSGGETKEVYLTASEPAIEMATFQIGFADDALVRDISDALTAVNGTVIDGPSALGLYRVAFSEAEACKAARMELSENPPPKLIETVSACE